MARVEIQSIVENLDSEMQRALEDAISCLLPHVEIDSRELFREFLRAVGRKCSSWEDVPDNHVEKFCPNCRKNV